MYLTLAAVQAWLEPTKLTVSEVDTALEGHVVQEVLGAIGSVYDVSGWIDSATTPSLVLTIMSMKYASRFYARVYSENPGEAKYAIRLAEDANTLLAGVVDKSFQLVEITDDDTSSPLFYPTDVSSAQDPTADDPSLGPAAFSMGRIW